jgi:hypothetical protein
MMNVLRLGEIACPQVTRGLFEVHVAKGPKPPASAYVAVQGIITTFPDATDC